MIDPAHALAFSIQANPGVYAVLLGSGVSRAAKIPTGWEITLDLIRKLATLHGETDDPDPERWYRDKFDKEADYSDLLDDLAKTPSERQQLLRAYLEPNDQEREDGEKQPTAAHRAIAALAAQGFVRVILTTNFDRLTERALEEADVVPTVLSSPDQVQGALPLIHTKCCVLKVHGDYRDTRIRNTPAELAAYPPEFDHLLDRIFDEFGLVVCGWSGEWDTALRNAIYRAPSRRFTTYWAARGEPGEEAAKLINHRRAQVIPIKDADTFFQTVQQQVESIEEFSQPHLLSVEAAVASLKRYLSEPRYRIQLSDLVGDTAERIVGTFSGEGFDMHKPEPTKESITVRVRAYEAACSTLLAMATVGGFWAEEEHFLTWQRTLRRLGTKKATSGKVVWLNFQLYPATLLLYALGVGAVAAERPQQLQFLERILTTTLFRENQVDTPAVRALPPFRLISGGGREMLEGMERHYAPLTDWIHDAMRPHAKRILPDDDSYTLAFDKLEILIALNYAYHAGSAPSQAPYWTLPGAFGYRHENKGRVIREMRESLTTMSDESPFVTCNIFGKTAYHCIQGLAALEEFIPKLGWGW